MLGLTGWFFSGNQQLPHHPTEEKKSLETQYFEADSYDTRLQLLDQMANRVIHQKIKWPTIHRNQFAQMHLALDSINTSLEGTHLYSSASFWHGLITIWADNQGCFFPFKLSQVDFQSIKGTFQLILRILDLEKQLGHKFTDKALEEIGKEIHTIILSELKTKGYIYVPMGYRDTNNNEGHEIPCKYILKGNKIIAFLLNKGAGIEKAPLLKWSPEVQDHYCMRYFPIEFEKEAFFGEIGLSLVCRNLRLRLEEPPEYMPGYSPEDVYSMMLLLGKVRTEYDFPLESRIAKPQLGPSCADMAARLVIHDLLLDLGSNETNNRRIFCTAQLGSLIAAFHQFCAVDNPHDWNLLKKAVTQFGVRVDKIYPQHLFNEEFILCEAIISHLNRLIQEHTKEPTPSLLEYQSIELPTHFEIREKTVKEIKSHDQAQSLQELPDEIPMFDIKKLPTYLESWSHIFHSKSSISATSEDFYFICRAFSTFPIPKVSDLWEELPLDQIPDCLWRMYKLVDFAMKAKFDGSECHFIQKILLIYGTYAIADKLTRRNPQAHMKGFHCPYWLDLHGENLHTIPLVDDANRYERIEKYFRKMQQQEKKPLFEFNRSVDLAKLAQGLKNSHYVMREPETSYAEYLLQFRDEARQLSLEDELALLWTDPNCTFLPFETHLLRYFSLMAKDLKCVWVTLSPTSDRLYQVVTNDLKKEISLNHVRGLPSSENSPLYFLVRSSQLLTMNQIVLQKPDNKSSIPPEFYQDLLRIVHLPNLQITSALDLLSSYLPKLNHAPYWWCALEYFFFHPKLLKQKIKNNPEIVPEIQRIFLEALRFYQNTSNQKMKLFLLRMSCLIDRFVKHSLKGRYQTDFIEECLIFLNELRKEELDLDSLPECCLLTICMHDSKPVLDLDAAKQIFVSWFHVKLFSHTYFESHFHIEALNTFDRLQSRLKNIFEDEENRKILLQTILGYVLTKTVREGKELPSPSNWKGVYPVFKNEIFNLNLKKGTLKFDTGVICRLPPLSFRIPEHLFNNFPEFFLREGEQYFSTDGIYKISFNGDNPDNTKISKKMTSSMGTFWYDHVHAKVIEHNPYETFVYHNYGTSERWIPAAGQSAPQHELFIDEKTDKIIYFIEYHNGCKTFKRPEGDLLVNLTSVKESFPLIHSLIKSFDADRTGYCFYDPRKKCISSLSLSEGSLNFRIKEEKKDSLLYSNEYEGYFIPIEQDLHLVPTGLYLLLRNDSGDIKVIFPACTKIESRRSLNPSIKFSCFNSGHHFIFSYDPQNEMLISDSTLENIFLTFLFAHLNDYKNACRYLARSRKFSGYDSKEDGFFRDYRFFLDHSAEALGFYLKLILHVIEHEQQPLYQNVESLTHHPLFLDWVKGSYLKYLRAMSTEHTNRIPGYIRLTRSDERTLCSFLKTKLPGFMSSMMLGGRYRILSSPNSELTGQILPTVVYTQPQSIIQLAKEPSLRHLNFHSSEKPMGKYFVRNKHIDFGAFCQLYNRARASDPTLKCDIFFILQSYANKNNPFASLLWIVQQDPSHFKDLNLDPSIDFSKQLPQIQVILTKAQAIHASQEVNFSSDGNFLSSVWKVAKKTFQTESLFNYSSHFTLRLLPIKSPSKIKWFFSDKIKDQVHLILKDPLNVMRGKFFRPAQQKTEEFFLSKVSSKCKIESHLIKNLTLGHEELLKQETYILNEGIDERTIQSWLEAAFENDKRELARLKTLIEKQANFRFIERLGRLEKDLLLDDAHETIRHQGAQVEALTMEKILLEALLLKNPTSLLKYNSALSPEMVYYILEKTMVYLATYNRYLLLKQCLNSTSKEWGNLCTYKNDLDLFENPETLVYTFMMQRFLRQEQLDLLKWFHLQRQPSQFNQDLFFSLRPGGGKTSTILPLLVIKSIREGKVPVVVSPPFLYSIEKELLKRNLNHFALKLKVLEISLRTDLSLERLEQIYLFLLSLKDEKMTLMVIPETLYALHLKYSMALKERNEEKVELFSKIFEFIKTNTCSFIDESRANLGPLTQAIISFGQSSSLPKNVQKLYLQFYQHLISIETLKLQENKQAESSPDEISTLQKQLASTFASFDLLEIPSTERSNIVDYWLNLEAHPPLFLEKQRKSFPKIASLIVLTKEFLLELFPATMNMIGQMQYGHSTVKGEEIASPRRRKRPTQTYFDNPRLTAILSIQYVLQRGLSQTQTNNLVHALLLLYTKEMSSGISEDENSATKQFVSWGIKEIPLSSIFSFDHYQKVKEHVFSHLHRNLNAIFWYLENCLLPQIQFNEEQFVATPAHLISTFFNATFFSAYPGSEAIYPFIPTLTQANIYRQDFKSSAAVIRGLCASLNQEVYQCTKNNPQEVFAELLTINPSLFKSITAISDAGGLLRDYSNEEIAKALLDLHEYDGVLLFDSNNEDSENNLMLWLASSQSPVELKGNDIKQSLKLMGLQWEKLKLMTLFDPSHTIGADIIQPDNAQILILLGEGLTLGDLIQARMRLRQFSDEQNKKRISWCIRSSLAEKVEKQEKTALSPQSLIQWSLKNDSKLEKREILLRAYQMISFYIEQRARSDIDRQKDAKAKIDLFEKYQNGLISKVKTDFYESLAHPIFNKNTRDVLWEYAELCYKRYGFKTGWERNLIPYINYIIEQTAALIDQTPSRSVNDLYKESEIHCDRQKEVDKDVEEQHYDDLTPCEEKELKISIFDANFLNSFATNTVSVRKLFRSDGLSPHLFLTQNSIHTLLSGNKPLGIQCLKPIDYMLVVITDEKTQHAFGLSHAEALHFQTELESGKRLGKNLKEKIALFTAKGILSQPLQHDSFKNISEKDWFQDVLIDLNLINGNMINPIRFKERLKNWKDFLPLWEKISHARFLKGSSNLIIEKLVQNK